MWREKEDLEVCHLRDFYTLNIAICNPSSKIVSILVQILDLSIFVTD